MPRIYLQYSKLSYEDGFGSQDHSHPNTITEWKFGQLSLTYGNEFVDVGFTPKVGQLYYALVAIYDTDDSLGWNMDANIKFFDVYETECDARRAESELNNCQKNQYLVYTSSDGKQVKLDNPWSNYFESFGNIEVLALKLAN
jgi:hypothetical protein